jgi:hypothetical protein
MSKEQNLQDTSVSQHISNEMLAAGFRSVREQKRFSKLIALAAIYQQGDDWDSEVSVESKLFVERELIRLKFPDGWQHVGSYELLKQWFFETCR